MKAFHYYLETNDIKAETLDDTKLKRKMREFIVGNIGYSVLAELSENKQLLSQMREKINIYSAPYKNKVLTYEPKNIQQ